MRRYNYFDDDDVAEQKNTRSNSLKKRTETVQDRTVTSEKRRREAPANDDALLPPKPSIGKDHLDDLRGVTDVAQYEKPAVMEVKVPSLDSSAITADTG